jgi:CheY-like chemotaxis protein
MALILIVEDNETNADMLGRRLKRAGHETLLATDGRAGVELTRRHRPDLVLMDLSLPIMDGWTAASVIKADAVSRTFRSWRPRPTPSLVSARRR